LRGLTGGALLGGLLLALSWKQGRALPVIFGMGCSLVAMAWIIPLTQPYFPAFLPRLTIDIAFPWYTLIGCAVTILAATAARRIIK
jgi:Na+/proline symporter